MTVLQTCQQISHIFISKEALSFSLLTTCDYGKEERNFFSIRLTKKFQELCTHTWCLDEYLPKVAVAGLNAAQIETENERIFIETYLGPIQQWLLPT